VSCSPLHPLLLHLLPLPERPIRIINPSQTRPGLLLSTADLIKSRSSPSPGCPALPHLASPHLTTLHPPTCTHYSSLLTLHSLSSTISTSTINHHARLHISSFLSLPRSLNHRRLNECSSCQTPQSASTSNQKHIHSVLFATIAPAFEHFSTSQIPRPSCPETRIEGANTYSVLLPDSNRNRWSKSKRKPSASKASHPPLQIHGCTIIPISYHLRPSKPLKFSQESQLPYYLFVGAPIYHCQNFSFFIPAARQILRTSAKLGQGERTS
jgi:hypothetical protein